MYRKPHVIRLVFFTNSFTKFRVRLNKPAIVLVSLNLFDVSPALTLEILLNKVFERFCIRQDFCLWGIFLCSNREQSQDIRVWRLGKLSPIQ